MTKALFIALAVLGIKSGLAEEHTKHYPLELVETWMCYSATDTSKSDILVSLTRYKVVGSDTEVGFISVAGVEHVASFEVAGFDRRWLFGVGEYLFVISPNGAGYYYELSRSDDGEELLQPSQRYICSVAVDQ